MLRSFLDFSAVVQNIKIVYSYTLLPMFLPFSHLIHFIFCILDVTFSAHGKGIAAFSTTLHVPLEYMGQNPLWDRVYLPAFVSYFLFQKFQFKNFKSPEVLPQWESFVCLQK